MERSCAGANETTTPPAERERGEGRERGERGYGRRKNETIKQKQTNTK